MLAQPPDELKLIRPFIHRGNQMAKLDPVITYYCYYWAIKLALERKLYNATPECGQYMMEMMQDLEERKEQLSNNELITNDIAAQAYVENFALKVFNNGSKAIEAQNSTQSTPDALQAAVVFLELTKIFSTEPEPEIIKKIKYAKFHATRILKALREGEDLNSSSTLSTPEVPPETQHSLHPPSLEDVPDEYYSVAPKHANDPLDESPNQTANLADIPSTIPPPDPTKRPQTNISDLDPLDLQPPSFSKSDSYFPLDSSLNKTSPHGVSPVTIAPTNITLSDATDAYVPPSAPSATGSTPPPPLAPKVPFYQSQQTQNPNLVTFQKPESTHQINQIAHQNPHVYHNPPASEPFSTPQSQARKPISPEDIAKAQKFAKWAISALDYDDIDNAIEQFRSGLAALSGS